MELALSTLAERLGLLAQVLCTPTSMTIAFGPMHDQQVSLMRLEPGVINLEKLDRIHAIVAGVLDRSLDVEHGLDRLRQTIKEEDRFGGKAMTLATSTSAGAIAVFFSANLHEICAAALVGLIVGLITYFGKRRPHTALLIEPVAATFAALLTVAIACFFPIRINLVLIASLIILVPGFSLTLAIRELAARHLIAGAARMFGASLVFLQLGFGVLLAHQLSDALPVLPPPAGISAGWIANVGALAISILSFSIYFNVKPRDMGWVSFGCILTYLTVVKSSSILGAELGGFLGALAIGVTSNLFARFKRRPASIMLIPGVILLVPGAVGLRSLSSLAGHDVVAGVETGFVVLMIATAIVAGLLIADTLAPPRESL